MEGDITEACMNPKHAEFETNSQLFHPPDSGVNIYGNLYDNFM